MIDETLKDLILNVLPAGEWPVDITTIAQALTAIYEIGLEVIGWAELLEPGRPGHNNDISARNNLRDEQRKAWAKACGVAE